MADETGLIFARIIKDGAGKNVEWEGINTWEPSQGMLWVHLDYTVASAALWIREASGLNQTSVDMLTAEQPDPRSVVTENDITLVLRGLNFNFGQSPEDMVSIRIWLDKNRIITTRHRNILSIAEIRDSIQAGHVPKSTTDFLSLLIDILFNKIQMIVVTLKENIEQLAKDLVGAHPVKFSNQVMQTRHIAVSVRRYMRLQKDAVTKLQVENCAVLSAEYKEKLRAPTELLSRYIEEFNIIVEKANVLQAQIMKMDS